MDDEIRPGRIIGIVLLCVLGLSILGLGMDWIATGNQFFLLKVFGVKIQNVKYEIFKESQPYNEGMAQRLRELQLQYIGADDNHKDAIASMIWHEFANYDMNRLPPDARSFLQEIHTRMGASQ